MTVLIRLPGDPRPRRYRCLMYGAHARIFDYGNEVAILTLAEAEAGRIAHEDEISRCAREGD